MRRACTSSCPHTRTSLVSRFLSLLPLPPAPTLFPYTTLFRSMDIAESGLFKGTATISEAEIRGRFEGSLTRSEEHTSELQSPDHLVCRLLLEKKKSCLFVPLNDRAHRLRGLPVQLHGAGRQAI